MKAIRLFRNSECAKCTRYARLHHLLDWLNRFEDSTDVSPLGRLRIGEIAVQNLASGATLKGVECFQLVCKHIPLYWLLLPLFYFHPFRAYVEREVSGCRNDCQPRQG